MKLSRTKIVVIALYAATWIGGWIVYPRDMRRRALAEHAYVVALDKRDESERPEYARQFRDRPSAFRDGPRTKFRWCVPILPGVLLASSDYQIGPLWGNGGLRIVIFYGFGTIETSGFSWIS